MKRLLYLASSILLLGSTLLAGNVLAAGAHHAAAKKMISLQLCSSTPYGVPATKDFSQGIRNGEHLAMNKWRGKLRKVGVKLLPAMDMDDAKADGSTYDPNKEAQNATACLSSNHTIGFVGPLNSGAAVAGEPVLNKGHMAQISPANTFVGLTSTKPWLGSGGRAAQEPATFKHQIPYVTYYRTVTTDNIQGAAGALFAKNKLHAKTVYAVDDKTSYSSGLTAAFVTDARKIGLKVLGYGHVDPSSTATVTQTSQAISSAILKSNPDIVYCGCDPQFVGPLGKDVRQKGFTKPWLGGDALDSISWIQTEGPAAVHDYATSVGPDPATTSKSFDKLYKKVYGKFFRNPGPQAYDATSYDAAGIILKAVWEAARAHKLKGSIGHMRLVVVANVRHIHFSGATGKTTFDANGDTSNQIISVYKTTGGTYKYLGRLKPKGYKPAP